MTIMTPDSLTPENQMPVKLDPGDVCIAASYATGTPDIRRNSGEGRVLVYDENFNLKGALWTGRTGLVLGLAYCPLARELYVSDSSAKSIDRFSCAGELLFPHPDQQGKPFGTMACAHSGGLVTGEHIKGDKFPFIGGGEIYAFNQNGTQTGVYACERDPGKFGFHGVTSLVLENE
ncbi:MAG TPA: hypothetical protein ENJ42_03300, partial [Hellea balneolensis]|nr:hypothetical protein [Hellea balneolensis]